MLFCSRTGDTSPQLGSYAQTMRTLDLASCTLEPLTRVGDEGQGDFDDYKGKSRSKSKIEGLRVCFSILLTSCFMWSCTRQL